MNLQSYLISIGRIRIPSQDLNVKPPAKEEINDTSNRNNIASLETRVIIKMLRQDPMLTMGGFTHLEKQIRNHFNSYSVEHDFRVPEDLKGLMESFNLETGLCISRDTYYHALNKYLKAYQETNIQIQKT